MYYGVTDAEIMDFIYVFKDEELMEVKRKKTKVEDKLLKAQA